MQDGEIIAWLGQYQGVWVHADDKARVQHRKQILTSGISTLWVHRPRRGMSGVSQLRAVAYVIEEFLARKSALRRAVHCTVVVQGAQHRERVRLEPYTL